LNVGLRRRFNVGGTHVLNNTLIKTHDRGRREGGRYTTSVECLFSMTPSYTRSEEEEEEEGEEEEEIQR
jgi:hypothetical protein